ncbi:putative 4-coumarate-CoA ligase 1 [Zancudomyces culisetae]|uniref:Putative 4-coumarate-CoA ligase 1 n=1 Tax=Zancudomyces culisetae TaxID=1213189 RepID=A0A1R1PM27_ZANCU|nr:putative 4-coumarate-CoA ligase 1 [Zancudomyces culisetae]|eukprot:OMH82031.1 putative 4-coumarate-CoA ligase 1 [Zancudomyces culisetae]
MIFKSQYPDIPVVHSDLATHIFAEAKHFKAQRAVKTRFAICDAPTGKELTLETLEQYCNQFASALQNKLSLAVDDVVLVFSPNTIYYPVAVLGTTMMGGVATLANPTYNERELAHQIKDANAKAIVTQSHLLPVALDAIKHSGASIPATNIVLVDIEPTKQSQYVHIEDFLCQKPFTRFTINTESAAKEKLAVLSYSSGTTDSLYLSQKKNEYVKLGLSKGVMLTHHNLISNQLMNRIFDFDDGWLSDYNTLTTFMGVLPFYHIYGFTHTLLVGISSAVGVVVIPKFEPNLFFSAVQKYKVNIAHLVPPIIIILLNNPDVKKYDLSSLRHISTGAAPLGDKIVKRFEKMYRNITMIRAYGLTEASPTVTKSTRDCTKTGCSGKLMANVEAKVVDEDNKNLGVDEIGELCFRGPFVMKGYLNNLEATKNTVDETGFLHTGDIGYIDKDGDVYIIDRKKELIKYKGTQVPPAELEALLLLHPDVVDSAVTGIYVEEEGTELPKAFVALSPSLVHLTEEEKLKKAQEIRKWLDGQVASYKRLRGGLTILDAIPKSASGKILRRTLRDMEKSKSDFNSKAKL